MSQEKELNLNKQPERRLRPRTFLGALDIIDDQVGSIDLEPDELSRAIAILNNIAAQLEQKTMIPIDEMPEWYSRLSATKTALKTIKMNLERGNGSPSGINYIRYNKQINNDLNSLLDDPSFLPSLKGHSSAIQSTAERILVCNKNLIDALREVSIKPNDLGRENRILTLLLSVIRALDAFFNLLEQTDKYKRAIVNSKG